MSADREGARKQTRQSTVPWEGVVQRKNKEGGGERERELKRAIGPEVAKDKSRVWS